MKFRKGKVLTEKPIFGVSLFRGGLEITIGWKVYAVYTDLYFEYMTGGE